MGVKSPNECGGHIQTIVVVNFSMKSSLLSGALLFSVHVNLGQACEGVSREPMGNPILPF
jgi:hypothetical protein